ncbi:unnamed protein product [Rodentolepis nana]|uniref:Transmembrane protein n=1 Tax=Rodentolepis nana TaxID=102285 RepID=A0A0R3TTI3_RODNA|nr:unnamed protein product [Rodentolepis nana]
MKVRSRNPITENKFKWTAVEHVFDFLFICVCVLIASSGGWALELPSTTVLCGMFKRSKLRLFWDGHEAFFHSSQYSPCYLPVFRQKIKDAI